MIEFDKQGYTYSYPYMAHNELMKQVADMRGVKYVNSQMFSQLFASCKNAVPEFEKGIRDKFDWTAFADFVLNFLSIARRHDPIGRFMEAAGAELGRQYKYDATNESLMTWHTLRFIRHGKMVYKLAPHKADFLSQLQLDIPGSLLFTPFKEFMISIPKGVVVTDLGSLMNIYVSEEPFDPKFYEDERYVTDDGVKFAISQPNVKKIFRAMGVFYKDDGTSQTAYYQMPVSDSRSVTDVFKEMIELSALELRPSVMAVFKIVLNTCAYLGVRDADIQNVLGIKYTASSNPKKVRNSERNNRLYGYDHFYVGRIYDERCRKLGGGGGEGSPILKRFKVRAHIRAQWYGPRSEGVPGTEQRLILIDEFEKGSDLDQALSEKVTEVGR